MRDEDRKVRGQMKDRGKQAETIIVNTFKRDDVLYSLYPVSNEAKKHPQQISLCPNKQG